jgi:hypothetical protein
MKLISHRGNISGKNLELENHPDYIDEAIKHGYDVEIDIWMISGNIFLGHDEPQFSITSEWLKPRSQKLWIHCKNIDAIEWLDSNGEFNYFWHENDTLTLTSKKIIWAYPGKQPILNSIAVMPELFNDNVSGCLGICSDYISSYNYKEDNIIKG